MFGGKGSELSIVYSHITLIATEELYSCFILVIVSPNIVFTSVDVNASII
jgi:hypothetical protein